MQDQIAPRERLNASQHLFLKQFGPGTDALSLRIEVFEAFVATSQPLAVTATIESKNGGHFVEIASTILDGARPLVAGTGCANFIITFERYISFCARDESYILPEKHEDYSKRLRQYETSKFLEFFHASTRDWALEDHIGPVKHFAVVCNDVVIDVISKSEPTITMRIIE